LKGLKRGSSRAPAFLNHPTATPHPKIGWVALAGVPLVSDAGLGVSLAGVFVCVAGVRIMLGVLALDCAGVDG
jgi:hypothetical protein